MSQNKVDTPGMLNCTEARIVETNGFKKLRMPRNHPRVTQTSIDMLKSWRANCDIQMLLYDSPPESPDMQEISRVTDYVVGYTCKGGKTVKEEKDQMEHLIKRYS